MRTLACIALIAGCDRSAPARDDAAVAVVPTVAPGDAEIDAPPPHAEEVLVPSSPGLSAFYLDREETTIANYQACIKAKQCTVPNRRADLEADNRVAIGGVTFDQARAFCAWRGKRLPRPEEWKYAAYGDKPRDYPWGSHRPLCERAWLRGCSPDNKPTSPGRPAGASAFGVLDMIGNVAEWADSGATTSSETCVHGPSTSSELLGGDVSIEASSPGLIRRDTLWPAPRWFANPGQGIRCARSIEPPSGGPEPIDPELRAMVEGGSLVVEAFATAREAFARVETLCAKGKRGLPIAGDLAGERGWLVAINGAPTLAAARKLAPPTARVIAAPTGLARVIGIATCGNVAAQSTLQITSGKHRWTITRPSGRRPYQLWLPPGGVAKLELECKRPPPKGSCEYGMTMAGPAEVIVPRGPRSGLEGPAFESDGSYDCD